MDALSTLLELLKHGEQTDGQFAGFLNVLIGRKITKDGAVVSAGMSWRDLAGCLKKVRWDPEAARELGLDPDDLPPRDRQRYWYSAISHAKVDTPSASALGDRFAQVLRGLGYEVSASPHS